MEQVILAIQDQVRGPAPKDQLIVLDGKEPKRVPSQHYLGSTLVDQTNEIPVARELFI